MRIHDRNLTGAGGAEANRTAETDRTGREQDAGSAGSRSGDRVELSSGLGSLSRAVSADAMGRSRRVESLAALYQKGAYHPDSRAVSRAMVNDALSPAER